MEKRNESESLKGLKINFQKKKKIGVCVCVCVNIFVTCIYVAYRVAYKIHTHKNFETTPHVLTQI